MNTPRPEPRSNTVARWLFNGVGIALAAWVLYWNQSTLVLVGIGFFLAYLLNPAVLKMENRGFSRNSAIVVLIALVSVVFLSALLVLIPQVQAQIRQTAAKVPTWGDWIGVHFSPWLTRLKIPVDQQNFKNFMVRMWEWISANLPALWYPFWEAFRQMFAGVSNFIVGTLNILLVPVFTFYLLRDFNRLRDHFYAALPPSWRPGTADWMGELDKAVGGFLRGQCIIAMILAGFYSIVLSLIGAPMGAVLGVISGVANLVPYMSLVVGLIPSLLLSFIDAPDFWRLLWILLIYIAGQFLEGFVLSPKIMGKHTGLHPVIVMVSIIIGGNVMGLTGIVFAVPIAAVVKVILNRRYTAWKATWEKTD
jgi:predicted PurR-regulated permease PerM